MSLKTPSEEKNHFLLIHEKSQNMKFQGLISKVLIVVKDELSSESCTPSVEKESSQIHENFDE